MASVCDSCVVHCISTLMQELMLHFYCCNLVSLFILFCIEHTLGMADPNPEVVEVEVAATADGQGNGTRLVWTPVMSGFILRRFTALVGEGVKTDKGFKEVHLNAVAKDLSEFAQLELSGTQVYNHLRKWRSRWVKVCRLKQLSGALWDESNYMITLDDDHYNGHVKVRSNLIAHS